MDRLGRSATEFFNVPGKITDLAGLTPAQVVVGLIGAIYYAAFVKSLANPREFNRTDDDLRVLATLDLRAGNFDRARTWISQEKKKAAESFNIRAALGMASGRFDEAADQARRALKAAGDDESDDMTFMRLINISTEVQMSPSQHLSFFRYLIGKRAPDAVVAPSVVLAAVSVDDPEEVVNSLIQSEPTELEYPLTRSTLAATSGNIHEAQAILRRSLPGSEIEELLRLVFQCTLVCIDPDTDVHDTHVYLHDWFHDSFPIVQQLAEAVKAGPYQVSATSSLAELIAVLDQFLRKYGTAPPFPASEALQSRERLIDLAKELAESDVQLTRLRLAHDDLWK